MVRQEMMYINCIQVTPEMRTTYHIHSFVEIVYVAEGRGIHRIGDEVFHVEKGDLALINYDVPHQVSAAEGPLLVYNFLFTPDYLDASLTASRNFFDMSQHFLLGNFYQGGFERYIHVRADGGENVHIRNIYDRLLWEYEKKQIGHREIMRGYLIELLITIFRLSMQELATMAEYSVSSFGRKFKAFTGMSVIRYIQTLRIEYACSLLSQTTKSVADIAAEIGYSDSKHFYTVFKKITGKLPRNFR